ncbi:MAG: hypothetical protein CBB92_01575 [Flammeovirgaceae bacterium TMED32]|nr:MAG: hypothetical protein CBB92_01575 [Flammeovirgaceae bacterium TMED32]
MINKSSFAWTGKPITQPAGEICLWISLLADNVEKQSLADSEHKIFGYSTALALLSILLVSCGYIPKLLPDVNIKTVQIVASSKANQGFPVAVDVVVVNDEILIKTIEGLSAKDWFSGRQQFLTDHSETTVIISREVVPGKRAPIIELARSTRVNAKAVFIFANYIDQSVNRLKIDFIEEAQVVLSPNTIELVTN